jgi:hypothetical protein
MDFKAADSAGMQDLSLPSAQALTSELPHVAHPVSLFHCLWPPAGLVTALIINVGWMGILGFALFKLIEPAFL